MLEVRMSQSGYCPRRLSAMLLGVKEKLAQPVWLGRTAKEGKAHEERLLGELRALGCDVVSGQAELRVDLEGLTLVGHIDANVRLSNRLLDSEDFEVLFVDTRRSDVDLSLYYPIEIKSMSLGEFQRWMSGQFDAFPYYASQFTSYITASHSDVGVYLVKDRSGGRRQLYIHGHPPIPFSEVEENVKQVARSVSAGELVAREYDPDNIECRRCEYRVSLCKPEAVVLEDNDMEEVLKSYVESRDIEATAKAERERCRDLIVAYGRSRFQLGSYVASVSQIDRESIGLQRLLTRVSRETIEDLITVSHFPRVSVVDLEAI